MNAGRLSTGLPALTPCTPLGCVMLAKTVHRSLEGMPAVIVGRSNIVGKPLIQLLLNENATVTVRIRRPAISPRCAAAPICCSRRLAGPRWCAVTG
jgi:5,10-methylene-tetrahydrofolate dehydrogenase/methenyl tetrahydrofolate cyclohydrolase